MLDTPLLPVPTTAADFEIMRSRVRHARLDARFRAQGGAFGHVVDFYFVCASYMEQGITADHAVVEAVFRRSGKPLVLLAASRVELFRKFEQVRERLREVELSHDQLVTLAGTPAARDYVKAFDDWVTPPQDSAGTRRSALQRMLTAFAALRAEGRARFKDLVFMAQARTGYVSPLQRLVLDLGKPGEFIGERELEQKHRGWCPAFEGEAFRAAGEGLRALRPGRHASNVIDAQVYGTTVELNRYLERRPGKLLFHNLTDGINARVLWSVRRTDGRVDAEPVSYCRDALAYLLLPDTAGSGLDGVERMIDDYMKTWEKEDDEWRRAVLRSELLSRLCHRPRHVVEEFVGAAHPTGVAADLDEARDDVRERWAMNDLIAVGDFLTHAARSRSEVDFGAVKQFEGALEGLAKVLHGLAGGESNWDRMAADLDKAEQSERSRSENTVREVLQKTQELTHRWLPEGPREKAGSPAAVWSVAKEQETIKRLEELIPGINKADERDSVERQILSSCDSLSAARDYGHASVLHGLLRLIPRA